MKLNRLQRRFFYGIVSLVLLQTHKVGLYPLSLLFYLALICPAQMANYLLVHRRPRAVVAMLNGIRDWKRGALGLRLNGEYERLWGA